MSLEAIHYTRGSLAILDQLLLPHQSIYVPIRTAADGFDAIKRMVVRGAPAIAIVAALSLAVELETIPQSSSVAEVQSIITEKLDYLVRSRPTAVNLSAAAEKLKSLVAEDAGSSAEVKERYQKAAEQMLVDDVQDNTRIGDLGAAWIVVTAAAEAGKVAVLTHCNTGSLATAGYGTALGIIRSLHAKSALEHAYCTETRPYNQGSRLTAYELAHDLPNGMATLITDSMAASLLQQRSVAAIVVGADRVARNGDTANKIGTYQLAIVARYHGVKFVVAAPTTSIDLGTESGKHITVEQRPGEEVLMVKGPVVGNDLSKLDLERIETVVPGVAQGVGVYNPSFDVTPKDLIDAIVTENGVAVKEEDGEFHLEKYFVS